MRACHRVQGKWQVYQPLEQLALDLLPSRNGPAAAHHLRHSGATPPSYVKDKEVCVSHCPRHQG